MKNATHYGPAVQGIPESWYQITPDGRVTHIANKATGMTWRVCTHTARTPAQLEQVGEPAAAVVDAGLGAPFERWYAARLRRDPPQYVEHAGHYFYDSDEAMYELYCSAPRPGEVTVDRKMLARVIMAARQTDDPTFREWVATFPLGDPDNPLVKLAEIVALPETGC